MLSPLALARQLLRRVEQQQASSDALLLSSTPFGSLMSQRWLGL